MSALKSGNLTQSVNLYQGLEKGVFAPPSLVDLNGDCIRDIVMIAFDGTIRALDGANNEVIWEHSFVGFESWSSPVLGFFSGDEVPDVFATLMEGTWPSYSGSKQILIDGRSGVILWSQSTNGIAMSTPLAVDINSDGRDEVIIPINQAADGRIRSEEIYYRIDEENSTVIKNQPEEKLEPWQAKTWAPNNGSRRRICVPSVAVTQDCREARASGAGDTTPPMACTPTACVKN